MENSNSQHNVLLITIAVILALILLTGVGFGFYYLGTKKGTVTSSNPSQTSTLGQDTSTAGTSGGSSSGEAQKVLSGLKGSGGTYDANSVESQLSALLSQQGINGAPALTLVNENVVKTSDAQGASAIKAYLDGVSKIIQGNQTTTLSDSALSGLFSGDTSALDAEITKNQKIFTDLKNVTTPQEAVTLQRKYLTLFNTSVEVMQAEKSMITSMNIDYQTLAKAQSLINLSKEIDSDVVSLKAKYGL